MKAVLYLIPALLLTSCITSTNYYQVYRAQPANGIIQNERIVFEDDNSSISYDLWDENGNAGFAFYNKTDDNITVDIGQSFFVHNGAAYPYYQGRTIAYTTNTATGISSVYPFLNFAKQTATTSGQSTSYIETPLVIVPPKTIVNIGDFNIVSTRFMDCDLVNFPSSSKVTAIKFTEATSPYVFYNIITYNGKEKPIQVENKFYVSEIANRSYGDMHHIPTKDLCGKNLTKRPSVFTKGDPDQFYIKYVKVY